MGRKSVRGSRNAEKLFLAASVFAVPDFENMTDLEHMPLPFMNFSHKRNIPMLHLWQIVLASTPSLYMA